MRENRTRNKELLYSICAILSVLSVILIILVFSRYYFHSDCAGYLFQAKEQAKQLKWFPKRFHYTTGVFGFSTSVYMLPFVNIVKNDYLLHEIGSIIALIVTVSLVWILFWHRKKIASIITILLCIPSSFTYKDMMFFQSAYINICTLIVLNLIAAKFLFESFQDSKENSMKRINKKMVISASVYLLVVFFTNYCGIANYVYVELPLLGAIAIVLWSKYGINIKGMLSEHKYIVVVAVTIIGVVIGKISYDIICHAIGFDTTIGTQQGGIILPESIHDVFWKIFPRLLEDFGVSSTNSLISLSTIKTLLGFIFFAVTIFVAPIYMVKHAKEYDEYNQILIYFSMLLNYAVLFIVFLGGEQEDRYYLPAMFGAQINNALFIENITRRYRKYLGNILYVLVAFFAFSIHVANYGYFIDQHGADFSIKNITKPQVENQLINLLDEHDLKYGFATFWYAYGNMVASNSRIEIAAYDQGNPLMPYFFNGNSLDNLKYYACSEDLYNPQLHSGRCFVLVGDGESIPEKYYDVCSEQYTMEGITILVYEQNIQNIESLKE